MKRTILFILFFNWLGLIAFCQSDKALFIGNSLTYYNSMPKMFQHICKEFDLDVTSESSCFSGVNLKTHTNTYWYKNKGFKVGDSPNKQILSKKYKVDTTKAIVPTTIKKILEFNYKYIFLQEQPNYIFNNELREIYTIPALQIIDSLAKKSNAKLYLSQTYTGKTANQKCLTITKCQAGGKCDKLFYCSHNFDSFEEMTDTIVEIYEELALTNRCEIIPVAEVFEHFRKYQPQIKLYKHGSHPTKQASFIIACTYFSAITNNKDFSKMKYNPRLKNFKLITNELTNFFSKDDFDNKKK